MNPSAILDEFAANHYGGALFMQDTCDAAFYFLFWGTHMDLFRPFFWEGQKYREYKSTFIWEYCTLTSTWKHNKIRQNIKWVQTPKGHGLAC